jgi:RNA-binding protein
MDRELKAKAQRLEPIMRIGKNGVTDNIIDELKNHLKRRKLIKIKLLKSFSETNDKKKVAAEIAEKTNSEIISHVGFTVVLWKK